VRCLDRQITIDDPADVVLSKDAGSDRHVGKAARRDPGAASPPGRFSGECRRARSAPAPVATPRPKTRAP
jgi:hypothetical protein